MPDGSSWDLPMSAAFRTAVEKTLQFEGGYVNDPADPGGETNFGLSRRAYPCLDIKNLSRDQAVSIYWTDVWLRHRINQLPEWASAKVFDTEVLAGGWGIRLLQQALGVTDDGIIGPGTVSACRCARDPQILMEHYRALLKSHYDTICREHPDLTKFLRGWDARALS